MSAEKIVLIALQGAMFASELALGCKATPADVFSLWRRPALLIRSFVSIYLVAPAVTLAILGLWPLPLGVRIGLMLAAISCAAPPSWKQMLAQGGHPAYVYSLLSTTTLLAVVTVPLSLSVLTALPLAADASVPPLQVAKVVAITFFVPLILGMLIGRLAPRVADRMSDRLSALAGYLLPATLVALLALNFTAVLQVGLVSYLTIVALTIVCLALGHWLGGPEPGDRTTLAVATASRYPGIATLIAASNFPDRRAVVMTVAYLIVTTPLLIVYARWWKKHTSDAAGTGDPASATAR